MTVGLRLVTVADDCQLNWIRLRNPWSGWWLERYDPDAHEGFGEATFTNDVAHALRFDSDDDARACWAQQSEVLPEREGQENRPLTVCSMETVDLSTIRPSG